MFVSLSLSNGVLFPVCVRVPVVPVPVGEFCHAYFHRTLLETLNYCQKNQHLTFKVTFVAFGQLPALITLGRQATDNFQRLF
jgi:hypothetical protein